MDTDVHTAKLHILLNKPVVFKYNIICFHTEGFSGV